MLAATSVAACALSAGLVTAAPAHAESRGFVLTNNSSVTLRIEGLNPVHCGDAYIWCQRGYSYVENKRLTPVPLSHRLSEPL